MGLPSVVPLKRTPHFTINAVVRRQEIGADEDHKEIALFKLSCYLDVDLTARHNHTIKPCVNPAFPQEQSQVSVKSLHSGSVFMRI